MSDQSSGAGGASEQLSNDTGTPTSGGGRRGLVIGGAVVAVAVAGGAAWAATSFLGQGTQPAEALPAGTLGYAAVDLDPSGGQKIEALKVLRKFPALEKELDLGSGDDLRQKIFEEMTSSCEGLDYAADVEPWLGNRVAMAAVDIDGEPTPVAVLQHTDAGAAEDGLAKVRDACGGDEAAYDVGDEWVLVGETDDALSGVGSQTEEGTLADDEDFQRWTEEAGDAGFISMYAAPEAGKFLAENAGDLFGGAAATGSSEGFTSEGLETPSEVPPEVKTALEEFEGAAVTIRFDDGGVELESAVGGGEQAELMADAPAGGSVVSTLPEDTAVALGFGVPDDLVVRGMERIASSSGGELTEEQMAQELEANLGVTPDDLQTLLGDALAVALGPDFDVRTMANSSGPESLPVGVKVKGDAGAIEDVVDKIRPAMGPMGSLLEVESEGDLVALSPSADYRSELVGEGSLGDSAAYGEVVEGGDDATAVFFVNFDAGDGGWLEGLAAGDPTVEENLAPLAAIGASSWVDDDVARVVVRLTTE